jgi:hypothetical protein
MKTDLRKKESAEWPFGPWPGQESPTLGANRATPSGVAACIKSQFVEMRKAAPLTPALSPRRGEGDCCLGRLPRAAFVPHLPWASIFLPFQGGSLAARAARDYFPHPHQVLKVVDETKE